MLNFENEVRNVVYTRDSSMKSVDERIWVGAVHSKITAAAFEHCNYGQWFLLSLQDLRTQ